MPAPFAKSKLVGDEPRGDFLVHAGLAAGAAAGAVSVVGLVVGAVFGAKAKSQWSDTLAACRGGDPTWCYPAAFDAHARSPRSA